MRVRLLIAYDGSAYHGWQIQPNDRTVEGELTRAAARILDCEPDAIKVQGASRTDAGVHALGQVAHLDHDTDRSLWDLVRGLNGLTDDDICVIRAEEAPPAPDGRPFHARFDARGKIYRYDIWNHRFEHPIKRHHLWRTGRHLDLERMVEAAPKLLGERDFAAFRASDCDAPTTRRYLERVDIDTSRLPLISITVEGNAFLKNMVRIIVGTLVDIAAQRIEPDAIEAMFATGDRRLGGITAPAQGLTLERIFYPECPWQDPPPRLGGAWLPEGT